MTAGFSYPVGVAGPPRRGDSEVDRKGRRTTVAWALPAAVIALMLGGGVLHFALSSDEPNPYSGTQLLWASAAVAVGAWVARRRPDHPLGWILLAGAAGAATTFVVHPVLVQAGWHAWPSWTFRVVLLLLPAYHLARIALFVAAPSVLPDGRWPRGVRLAIFVVGVGSGLAFVVGQSVAGASVPLDQFGSAPTTAWGRAAERIAHDGGKVGWWASLAAIGGLVVATLRAGPAVRRQQRWFLVGVAFLAVPPMLGGGDGMLPFPAHGALFDRSEQLGGTLLPLLLVVAVVHDGMLDIAVIVRRAVTYAVLTVLAAGVYVAVVGVVWIGWGGRTSVLALVGTGAVALALQPLRTFTQRWVSRRVYGGRDEPYEVLTSMARRLGDAPATSEVLPELAREIAESLRLPAVAIELDLETSGVAEVAASWGPPDAAIVEFPLVHAGAEIGRLRVAPRTPTEGFTARERALLADLARHAGIVAHDARLAADLRRSRLDLVVAREEERRRLRGDLHDGLGPTLASVSLGLDAAAAQLRGDDDLVALLNELNGEVREAMEDIRRLVYGLRPPALDELGLVRAIEAFARSGEVVDGDELPPLPAAVEVAAYRVTVEAITNVRRHAQASSCRVHVRAADGVLRIVVVDDGVGLGGHAPGVGMVSMRQRAADLGGQLAVGTAAGGGTEVRATFPLELAADPERAVSA